MKPITSLATSLAVTVIILMGLGFLASKVAVSNQDDVVSVAESDQAAEVVGMEIVIIGIRNDAGKVVVAVFDRARPFEAYEYERAIEYGEFDAVEGGVHIPLPGLRSGPYAVSLFHDENDDDDFNMDGDYPLEGYGTSGARDAYHEPTFEEASVDGGQVVIQMYYP